MDDFEIESERFQKLVPFGEEAFMVLRAHLIAERGVWQFIEARVQTPKVLEHLKDNNSPVRSGLGAILLAEALSTRDEIPPNFADIPSRSSTSYGTIWHTRSNQTCPKFESKCANLCGM